MVQLCGSIDDPEKPISYFFYGSRYIGYYWEDDRIDVIGSYPIFLWRVTPAFLNGFDATCSGAGKFSNYAYFFKGPFYIRYNWKADVCDYGVQPPAALAADWKLPPPFADGIDAALLGWGSYSSYLYFFRGDQYARYGWDSGEIDLVAPIANWGFPPPFDQGVNAVVNGQGPYAGKAYFFRGSDFLRYDWDSGQVDYVTSIAENWSALLEPATPRRSVVLYVTFDAPAVPDPEDRAQHDPNRTGLRAIAAFTDPSLTVSQFWCPNLNNQILQDGDLLALYLAGSFTEWATYFSNPFWRAQVDTWIALIKTTDIPIFAACGSHQLLGYAYGGWSAVGHMTSSGVPTPIAAEQIQGKPIFPVPRLREQGLFSVDRVTTDPILEGLPERMTFVQFHSDEVIDTALPPGTATRLAIGQQLDGCYQDPEKPELELSSDQQRCVTQLLRYDVPPLGRILYSAQFHPERGPQKTHPLNWDSASPSLGSEAADCSQELITRFLFCAKQYWERMITVQPNWSGLIFVPYEADKPLPSFGPDDLALAAQYPVLRRPGSDMG